MRKMRKTSRVMRMIQRDNEVDRDLILQMDMGKIRRDVRLGKISNVLGYFEESAARHAAERRNEVRR